LVSNSKADLEFQIHVVAYTGLELATMERLFGSKPGFFRVGPRTLPSGRVLEDSVYDFSVPFQSGDLSRDLHGVAEWLSTFLPQLELSVRVAILISPEQRARFVLDGRAVARILRLGASLDFDDVLSSNG